MYRYALVCFTDTNIQPKTINTSFDIKIYQLLPKSVSYKEHVIH